MAISKPRGAKGMRQVFVYDPARRAKVYVGSRASLRGPGGAKELERDKQREFAGRTKAPDSPLTVCEYAAEWLDLHHGPRTRRPADSTRALNESSLRPFLDTYADRALDAGITRREALAWAKKHPHQAKVVSAMFNDAVDDEACRGNPFANRRQEQQRGRQHVHPLTEAELDVLASIALDHWGPEGYGLVARAWILFGAWVGCGPGETFHVTAADLDFHAGEVTIRRVKPRGGRYPVDVVVFPRAAQDAVRAMPNIPQTGPLFRTVSGRAMVKGSLRYHWDPVRSRFQERVSRDRWLALTDGRPELAFYSLRHMCASVMAD